MGRGTKENGLGASRMGRGRSGVSFEAKLRTKASQEVGKGCWRREGGRWRKERRVGNSSVMWEMGGRVREKSDE